MDLAIGKVINKLKETGEYDNTLIFFLTDNGGAKVFKAINTLLRETLCWDGNDGIWAIRHGKWKLVNNKQNILELYDLSSDISEKTDLSGKYQQIVVKLKTEFKEWRSQMAEPMSKAKIRNAKKKK